MQVLSQSVTLTHQYMAVFSFMSAVHRKYIMKLLRKQRRPHMPPPHHTQEGNGKLEGKRDWDACRKTNKLGLHYLAVIIAYSLYLWIFVYLFTTVY